MAASQGGSNESSNVTPSKEELEAEIKDLEATLVTLQEQRKETEGKLKYHLSVSWLMRNTTNPEEAVRRHIKLLHEYNEIRDVALNFAGKLAEGEQRRTIDVLEEYGMTAKD